MKGIRVKVHKNGKPTCLHKWACSGGIL